MVTPEPFPTTRAVTLRELAAFLRLRPRSARELIKAWINLHDFPEPLPCTAIWYGHALNQWFARQTGMVAGEYAATAEDGTVDPFLARERRRSETPRTRSNHQEI